MKLAEWLGMIVHSPLLAADETLKVPERQSLVLSTPEIYALVELVQVVMDQYEDPEAWRNQVQNAAKQLRDAITARG